MLELIMLFSENERRELAEFFAKRFSDDSVRNMLARQAGLETGDKTGQPTDDWECLITTAQNRRRLPNLAIVASRIDQSDQNLQAVCNLLGARSRIIRNRIVTGLAAASVALGFGVAGWNMGAQEAPQPAALAAATAEAPAELGTPKAELNRAPTVETDPEPVATKTVATAPEAPTTEATHVTHHSPPETRSNGPAWRNGRCTYDQTGDFIGYWYAGEKNPGAVGQVVDVELGVNVRKDYPDAHNNFDKRTKVRCILKRGDKVKLTAAPILVPGNRYWVPLYHGDLVEEAPEENLVAVR